MNPKAVAALGIITTILGLVTGNWESLTNLVHTLLARPQAEAVIISAITGCSIASIIPTIFPKTVKRTVTRKRMVEGVEIITKTVEDVDATDIARAWMRTAAIPITFAISWRMVPTEIGLFYALLAAFAGTQVMLLLWKLLGMLIPQVTPHAFQPKEPTP